MPLLLMRRYVLLGLMAGMLTACGAHHPKASPSFTASGYIADRGAVRIWRKDDAGRESVDIIGVYSPYNGDNTTVTRYHYLQNNVRQIDQTQNGAQAQTVQIRFDEQGNPSFMQRQRAGQREKLSEDELDLYQFDAKRLLDVSQALRAGKVMLLQGQWRNNVLTTCQGNVVEPDFDQRARSWIAARAKRSSGQVGVAWLAAPEGTQLLLVANENFCHWQPKKSAM